MSGPSMIKRIWNIVSIVIVIAAVVLAVLLAGTRLIGLQPLTVLSGSMEPEIHTGSLVYVKKVEPKTLEVGDDITYMLSKDTYATHRIVKIIPKGYTLGGESGTEVVPSQMGENSNVEISFVTKGINNKQPDAKRVPDYNIVGKVQFSIPLLGYVAAFIQEPPGLYVAISVGAILILLVFLPDLLFDDKASEEESGNGNNKKNSKNKKKKEQDGNEPELCADAPETDTAPMTDGDVGNEQRSLAEEASEGTAADEAENAVDSEDQAETEVDSDTAYDEVTDADESADSDDESDGAKDDTEE